MCWQAEPGKKPGMSFTMDFDSLGLSDDDDDDFKGLCCTRAARLLPGTPLPALRLCSPGACAPRRQEEGEEGRQGTQEEERSCGA